jgi:hypothetical protein
MSPWCYPRWVCLLVTQATPLERLPATISRADLPAIRPVTSSTINAINVERFSAARGPM